MRGRERVKAERGIYHLIGSMCTILLPIDLDKRGEIDSTSNPLPVPVTSTELATLRAHLASVVAAESSSCSASPSCSSYFIEPVEWMETFLLGHVEGKVKHLKKQSQNSVSKIFNSVTVASSPY